MLTNLISRAIDNSSNFKLFNDTGRSKCSQEQDFRNYKNHVVIWPLENNIESVWSFFCALRDGVIPVVVPGNWPVKKLKKIREFFPPFGFFDGTGVEIPDRCAINNEGVFLALLTSGSSGVPQAIATTEQRLLNSIQFIHDSQGLGSLNSTGILLPICYSYALINQLLWAVCYEKTVYMSNCLMGAFESFKYLKFYKIEMLCMVSAQISVLSKFDNPDQFPLANVKMVNFAGSSFPISHMDQLQTVFPNARFLNNYGCTEAMTRLTCREVTGGSDEQLHVGRAVGDIKIKIGRTESTGPILFKGSSTALGKLSKDGGLEFFSEWIDSGDYGCLSHGELYLAGRRDQIVKIHGERFGLLEIENTILGLGFDHVMAWLDSDSNKIFVAVSNNIALPKNSFRQVCKNYLHRHIWPRDIYIVEDWPLNANLKTDRRKIKERCQGDSLSLMGLKKCQYITQEVFPVANLVVSQ